MKKEEKEKKDGFRVSNGVRALIYVLILAGLIAVGVYNYRKNAENFLNASLVNLLTIGIAIFITYIMGQKQQDIRRQKDVIFKLLEAVQNICSDPILFEIKDVTDEKEKTNQRQKIFMRKRELSNRVELLSSLADKFDLKDKTESLKRYFNDYDTFLGDHIQDFSYLSRSQNELARPLNSIISTCYEIMIDIYQ